MSTPDGGTREASTKSEPTIVRLDELATLWLACKNAEIARPSPASDEARRSDLLVIGRRLADGAGQTGPDGQLLSPFASPLARLVPGDLTAESLSAAMAVYAAEHAASSVRRVISTWRGFCRWLRREGWLEDDPAEGLEVPVREGWRPQPLDVADLGRIVAAVVAADGRGRSWPERDWALLSVFVGAGVRAGEAIGLRVNDMQATPDAGRLRVFGIRGRRRDVPVGPEVVAAVDGYLASRRARLGAYEKTVPLFVQADGRPFTHGTLDYLVSTWFRRAGVSSPKGSLAYALRHTYATLLIGTGASLRDVQRLLGHRDLSSTQAYTGAVGGRLEETALANPARALLVGVERQRAGQAE